MPEDNSVRFEPGYFTRLIVTLSWRWLLLWFGAAFSVTLFGYPGGICLTPLMWMASIAVGSSTAQITRADRYPYPIRAAVLAGSALGAGIGFISTMAAYLTIILPGVEDVQAPFFFIPISLVGVLVCAGLSALAAWLTGKPGVEY